MKTSNFLHSLEAMHHMNIFMALPHPHSVDFPPLPLTMLIVVTAHVSFTGGKVRQGLTWTCFLRSIQLKSM